MSSSSRRITARAGMVAVALSGGFAVGASASPAADSWLTATVATVKDKDKVKDKTATEPVPAAAVPAPTVPVTTTPTATTPATTSTPARTTPTATPPTQTTAPVGDQPAAPELAPATPPVPGESVGIEAVSGQVVVRLPGARSTVPLSNAATVPVGAAIDARQGIVELSSAPGASGSPQSAQFRGAIFAVSQKASRRPVTVLTLRGGDLSGCAAEGSGLAQAAARTSKVRSLWGSGHGRFVTKGRRSAATVRGTIWLTEDRCDGTYTRVKRGVVSVRDFSLKKTVTVRTGQRYLARAR